MDDKINLFTDGCARGNPGQSGAGMHVTDLDGNTIKDKSVYLGNDLTNNQAEYKAIILGLELCAELSGEEINVYSDSLLVVNHLNGVFKIRNLALYELYEQVKSKEKEFEKVTYRHIRRNENGRADQLANIAVDEHLNQTV